MPRGGVARSGQCGQWRRCANGQPRRSMKPAAAHVGDHGGITQRSHGPPAAGATSSFRGGGRARHDGLGGFRRTARRYSLCAADAEDAYQRSLEILLTRRRPPTAASCALAAHGDQARGARRAPPAGAHRRRGGRAAGADAGDGGAGRGPEETRQRRERVRRTAEALGALKPSEIQCLLLKALGYSYDEIAAAHRLQLDQGEPLADRGPAPLPRALRRDRVGRALRRFQPLLSAACDGEASAERAARLHARTCVRARLPRGAARLPLGAGAAGRAAAAGVVLPVLEQAGWWSRLARLARVGRRRARRRARRASCSRAPRWSARRRRRRWWPRRPRSRAAARPCTQRGPRASRTRRAAARVERASARAQTRYAGAAGPGRPGAGSCRNSAAARPSRRERCRRRAPRRRREFSLEAGCRERPPRPRGTAPRSSAAPRRGSTRRSAAAAGGGEFGP